VWCIVGFLVLISLAAILHAFTRQKSTTYKVLVLFGAGGFLAIGAVLVAVALAGGGS